MAVSAFLAAAVAALALIVVFRPFDRPLVPAAARVRIIAASFVGGQAVLGLVVAVLSIALDITTPALPVEPFLPVLLAVGAFGVAFAFRAVAARDAFTVKDRARAVVTMAVAQWVGIIGVVLAMLGIFLGA